MNLCNCLVHKFRYPLSIFIKYKTTVPQNIENIFISTFRLACGHHQETVMISARSAKRRNKNVFNLRSYRCFVLVHKLCAPTIDANRILIWNISAGWKIDKYLNSSDSAKPWKNGLSRSIIFFNFRSLSKKSINSFFHVAIRLTFDINLPRHRNYHVSATTLAQGLCRISCPESN